MNFETLVKGVESVAHPAGDKTIESVLGEKLLIAIKTVNETTKKVFFENEVSIYNYFNNEFDKTRLSTYYEALSELSALYITQVLSTVTEYSFNNTVLSVDNVKMEAWFTTHNEIGEAIVFQEIHNLAAAEWKEEKAAAELKEHLLKNNGLFLFGLQSAGEVLKAKMYLIVLKRIDTADGKPNLQEVLKFIKESPILHQAGMGEFESVPWLTDIRASFMRSGSLEQGIKSKLSEACKKEHVTGGEYGIYYMKTKGQLGLVTLHKTYGEGVETWVNEVAAKYNLSSGKAAGNHFDEKAKEENLFGCVAVGTLILMEDGTTRPIEFLKEGDAVCNVMGGISVCSDEKITNNEVNYLYAVNGDKPFMSLEHAVLTTSGWRCLRPDLAKQINDNQDIGLLQVGDVILKSETAGGELIPVAVECINIEKNTERCYDLHFREGYHSYVANGYCTLLNYPEITYAKVSRQMTAAQLQTMKPLIKHNFGHGSIDLNQMEKTGPLTLMEQQRKGICMMDLCLPGMSIYVPQQKKENSLYSSYGYSSFSLYKGYMMFDDEEPVRVEYEDNMIYWKRKIVRQGRNEEIGEEGFARFLHHRTMLEIKLVRNGKTRICYAVPDFSYQLTYGKKGEEQEEYAIFHLTYKKNSKGELIPCGEIRMPDIDEPISSSCSYFSKYIDKLKGTSLCVSALIKPFVCEKGISDLSELDFNFDLIFQHITGTAVPYEEEDAGKATEPYIVRGSLIQTNALETARRRVTAYALKQLVKTSGFLKRTAPSLATKEIAAMGAEELNVVKLYNVTELKDLQKLHEECFSAVKSMAMYEMTDEELQLCGETRPVIGDASGFSSIQAALAGQTTNKEFLQSKFTAGYFSSMFANCNATDYPYIADKFSKLTNPKRILGYYWRSSDQECFANEQGYKNISSKVYDEIYLKHVSDLKAYMPDAKKWAKELYEYCTDPKSPILTGLAFTYQNGGSGRITHLCNILRILDDTSQVTVGKQKLSYAQGLQSQILNALMQNIVYGYKGGQLYTTQQEAEDFAATYIRDLILGIINKESPYDKWDANIRTELIQQITDIQNTQSLKTQQEAIDRAVNVMGGIIALLFEFKRLDITSLSPKLETYLNNHKMGSQVCKALSLSMMYAVSIFQMVSLYKQFNKMTPLEKASVISQTIGMSYNLVEDICSLVRGFKEAIDFNKQMRIDATVKESVSQIGLIEASEGRTIEESIRGVGESEATAINNGERSAWSKFCEKGPKIIGGLINIAILGISTAVSIVQTITDFRMDEKALIKALDIIQCVSFGLATIVEVASLFMTIPYLGPALVFVGLVAAFVSMFVSHKEPKREESAVEKYIDKKCMPFMQALPVVPDSWAKDEK